VKKYLPALVCGFAAGVLNVVPLVKTLSCCLIIPVAAYFALVLNQKANRSEADIKASQAAFLGLATGIFAAFFGTAFDMLIVFLTREISIAGSLPELENMLQGVYPDSLAREVMDIMYKVVDEINKYGFSMLYTLSVFMSSLVVNSIFGIVGGLIGMQVINRRKNREDNNF
jgi:uncharacterized membrane protein YfcA